MEEVIRFALLGFGVGALYALASQGLIVIYRGSGVLNFALGAIGMAGVFVQWDSREAGWASWPRPSRRRWSPPRSARHPSLPHAPAATVLAARPRHRDARRAHRAAGRSRCCATARRPPFVRTELPTDIVTSPVGIKISGRPLHPARDRRRVDVALWLLYRYTKFGLATTAVAENERAASAVGLSPDRIAAVNWALGSALAAVAAILIAPIVTLQVRS